MLALKWPILTLDIVYGQTLTNHSENAEKHEKNDYVPLFQM